MKNIKKLISMLCIFALCFSITTFPVMAMEIPTEETDVPIVLSNTTNSFTYFNGQSESVRITNDRKTVRSTPAFNGLSHGTGTVVLKFTGTNTGNVFTLVFECNSTTTVSRPLAFTIATDTYDVTTAYSDVSGLKSIIIDFLR